MKSKLFKAMSNVVRTKSSKSEAEMIAKLERILQEGSTATKAEKAEARKKLREIRQAQAAKEQSRRVKIGDANRKTEVELPPLKSKMKDGGMSKKKKVPFVAVSVGMMPKGKAKMANGGMAYGKSHMYAAGGSVTMNPGLKALKKSSPKAFNKITGN
tara:strand:- start:19 stop:489 length:471 start_codon:yes stop_codon:yes gene_type:complete